MHALILVDLQNDFVEGGSLAVPNGREVIAIANESMPQFDFVVATQDWHPSNHGSFASQHDSVVEGEVFQWNGLQQVAWPDHCVQGTRGADFVPGLQVDHIDAVVQKGTDQTIDSYSGFFDNDRRSSTGLHDLLTDQQVDQLTIMGLATDYCVKFTVLDAIELGWRTNLLMRGCRGIDLSPGDIDRALGEMKNAGARLIGD